VGGTAPDFRRSVEADADESRALRLIIDQPQELGAHNLASRAPLAACGRASTTALAPRGLVKLNDTTFLDKPEHEVMGQVVATRIAIAIKMDDLHELKAKWLKWSFRFLICAFVGLLLQGAVLAISPPASPSATSSKVVDGSRTAGSGSPVGHSAKTVTASHQ
jgi:hypothetical protein